MTTPSEMFKAYLNWGLQRFGSLSPEKSKEAERRFTICSACPAKNNDKCDDCGCFIKVKIFSENKDSCPRKKW